MDNRSLKLLALKECLSGLDDEDIKELFKDINESLLIEFRLALNSELNNYKNIRYVVINGCYGGFGINDLGLNFIQKYSPKIQHSCQIDDGICQIDDGICRCHPILVLMILLLGKNIGGNCSRLIIEKVKLKYFENYQINEYDGLESIDIIPIDKPYESIPERPPTLFADIQQYAKEHNIELDLSKIEEFPKTGPYRVFD